MARALARKGAPFSVRFRKEVDCYLDQEAKRLRRPKGAIVEAYTEEMIRMRRFPGIGFRGAESRRRAWVIGAGLDVWEIVAALGDSKPRRKVMPELRLSREHVRLALAYQEEYPHEIAEWVDRARRTSDELRQRYPFIVGAPLAPNM